MANQIYSPRGNDLLSVVEPLVDAISNLILSAVTGNMEEVKSNCEAIAKHTQKTVEVARDIAIASKDSDLQTEVAGAINKIATSINNLVVTFNALVVSPGSTDSQRAFANTAKEVGDAINELMTATDSTFQKKLLIQVERSSRTTKALHQVAGSKDTGYIIQTAKESSEETIKLMRLLGKASTATLDNNKSQAFGKHSEQAKALGASLINCAKDYNSKLDSATRNALDEVYNRLSNMYDEIVALAKTSGGNYMQKVYDMMERAERLLAISLNADSAFQRMIDLAKRGVGPNDPEFLAAAQDAAMQALEFCKYAQSIADTITDPVLKKQIEDAIKNLRDISHQVIETAKLVAANPKDENLRRKLDEQHKKLQELMDKVLFLTNPKQDPAGRMLYAGQFIRHLADKMLDTSETSKTKFLENAKLMVAATKQFTADSDALAAQKDPDTKKKISDHVAQFKQAGGNLVNSGKNLIETRSQPQPDQSKLKQAKQDITAQHKNFIQKLQETMQAAGLDLYGGSGGPQDSDIKSGQNELVTAAREQADEARRLIAEVEKMLSKMADGPAKRAIYDALNQLKDISNRVIHAAEALAVNPSDTSLAYALQQVQKELGEAIGKVVGLTAGEGGELSAALSELLGSTTLDGSGSEDEIFAITKALLDLLWNAFFKDPKNKKNATDMISTTKSISEKTAQVAKALNTLASKVNDPVYKELLQNASKFVRDRAMQLKIIAAVKVAGQGNSVITDDNQILSSAKVLQNEVQEVVKVIQTAVVKKRIASTYRQILAIRKVVGAWVKSSKKF